MANGQTSNHIQIAGRKRVETYQLSSRTQTNEQTPAEGIAWFRNALEKPRRNLLAKINRSKEEAQTAEKIPAHIAGLWTETVTREDMLARADSSRRLLRLVEAAILRIHKGTFGDCTECQQAISLTRSKAIACASRCISCEEQLERENGRRNSLTSACQFTGENTSSIENWYHPPPQDRPASCSARRPLLLPKVAEPPQGGEFRNAEELRTP